MPEGKSEIPADILAAAEKAFKYGFGLRYEVAIKAIAEAILAERKAEHARCNATVSAAWGANISLEAFEEALAQLPDSFRPHLTSPPSTEENLQHD